MKKFFLLSVFVLIGTLSTEIAAQSSPSAGGALFRSLVIPGWGHKYSNQGQWNGGAKFHIGIEASLWTGLIGSVRAESQAIQAYESWATSKADVTLKGRNRSFVLNVANYDSDEAYREALLRNRAWDVLDSVSGENFNWEWESEEARNEFRSLRDEADSLDRRQTFLMISLLGNRLVSGFNALRNARRNPESFSAKLVPIFYERGKLPQIHISANITF